MAEPKAMDLKNCTVKLVDGTTPTPNELELKIDEGNIQWERKRNIEAKKDRGNLDYLKEGDQEPMTVQLECRYSCIKSSTGDPVTPYEFLTKTGNASSFLSTGPLCAADTVDIVVETDQTCGTTVEDEITTFADFAYETIGGDFRNGTLSISGLCNAVGPTAVRTTLA